MVFSSLLSWYLEYQYTIGMFTYTLVIQNNRKAIQMVVAHAIDCTGVYTCKQVYTHMCGCVHNTNTIIR